MHKSEFRFRAHRLSHIKAKNRVLKLLQRHGLSFLSAYEVYVLLRHHVEGALFAVSFRKKKVCNMCNLIPLKTRR